MEMANKNILANWVRNTAEKLTHDDIGTGLETDSHFLPNFCETNMVIRVVVIAELLAIVISLVMSVPNLFFASYFEALLQISIFIQWIALSSALCLCLTRKYLRQLPNRRALLVAYLMLLCITWLVNEGAIWILWATDKIPSPRPIWYPHFQIQNLTVSAIINALMLGYFLAKQELKLRTISEAHAKMQALQSRIRPHFVFNSMNIIASLTRSNPTKAEAAIEDMSEIFRMMLNEDENVVPIKREIEVAKKYLALEELRLDNRLKVDWDIGKFPRKAVMPILTLQPLLENAIVQGIEPIPDGGTVNVRLWEENEKINIRISNPLPLYKPKKQQSNQEFAFANIRQRFTSYYGDKASLTTEKTDGRFIISVVLPMRGENP